MGDRTAFFYGTLMAEEVLYRVCFGTSSISKHSVQHITTTPAILHHHRRSRVQGCDYPGVIPSKGSSVRGTYVTGLTDGDIFRLDMFEGSQYALQHVTVYPLTIEGNATTGEGNVEGEAVQTSTYIWIAPTEELEDREWDYATFREEKLKYWIGGHTEEFVEVDAWAEEDGTDPTGGRGFGGDIAKALDEEHGRVKQDKADDGEPLKSAV